MAATSVKTTQEIQQQTLDESNSAVRVNLVAGTITGADGAILDGVSSSIKATVIDLTNSNPVAVAIVDGSGTQLTSFGGGTQYNDGSVRGSATGTLALGDDGTNLQSLACSAAGRLSVDVNSSALPSGAATAALQTQPGVDIGDVTINNASGGSAVNIQDGGNSITVDGTVTANAGSGTFTVDSELPAAAALADATVNPTTPLVGSALEIFNGTTWDRARGDTTNGLDVDVTRVGGNVTVVQSTATNLKVDASGVAVPVTDNSGSLTVDGTVTANLAAGTNNIGDVDIVTMPNVTLAAGTNTNEVVGDAAHDAAVAGNPVLIGLEARSTAPTAVGDGDVVRAEATLLGKQVVYPWAIPASSWNYAAASGGIVNTTGVTIKTAGGAGIRNYITDLHVINGHASVSTDVQIRDGASGTVIWRGFAQAGGGGVAVQFAVPLRGSANTLLEAACGTTGAAVYVNVSGFSAAE